MEAVLLEIIRNSKEPVLITTLNIHEIVNAVQEATKVTIYFKLDVWVYFNSRGQERQRKAKNTYQVWVKRDMYEIQEEELKIINKK